LRAKVPNLDEAGFARMAGDAEKNCPVSTLQIRPAISAYDPKRTSDFLLLDVFEPFGPVELLQCVF
jgi:hypothetical protein